MLKQAPQVRKFSARVAVTTSPKMLYASAAAASKKPVKIAFANVATKCDPPKKGNVTDPYDLNPLQIYNNNVLANPNAVTVFCEDDVILDSGASNCMVPSFCFLDLTQNQYAIVCLADGTVHNLCYKGILWISVTDTKTKNSCMVSMLDTLLVPGLRTILWFVTALFSQGHDVIFGLSMV